MPKLANPPRPKGWQAPPIEEAQEGDVIITHSEIDAFRRCQLMWMLAYKDKWRIPEGEREDGHALTKGSLYHDVMEIHYTGLKHIQDGVWGQEQGLDHIARNVAALLWPQDGTEQSELQSLVWWMYQGYVERYGNDPQWEILAVEVKFQARLRTRDGKPTKYLLKGKLDLVIRDRKTGKIWIVDHKSGANLPDQMELDIADQFGLYAWLLREAGIPVIGAIHSANRTTRNQGDRPENQDENGEPLKASTKKQTLEQRMRRTLLNRGDKELDSIAADALAVAVNAYPEAAGLNPLPIYSAPKPSMGGCNWCDFLDAHLAARKGRSLQQALPEFGFEQVFEERY